MNVETSFLEEYKISAVASSLSKLMRRSTTALHFAEQHRE
jgi:hypothetical protein